MARLLCLELVEEARDEMFLLKVHGCDLLQGVDNGSGIAHDSDWGEVLIGEEKGQEIC